MFRSIIINYLLCSRDENSIWVVEIIAEDPGGENCVEKIRPSWLVPDEVDRCYFPPTKSHKFAIKKDQKPVIESNISSKIWKPYQYKFINSFSKSEFMLSIILIHIFFQIQDSILEANVAMKILSEDQFNTDDDSSENDDCTESRNKRGMRRVRMAATRKIKKEKMEKSTSACSKFQVDPKRAMPANEKFRNGNKTSAQDSKPKMFTSPPGQSYENLTMQTENFTPKSSLLIQSTSFNLKPDHDLRKNVAQITASTSASQPSRSSSDKSNSSSSLSLKDKVEGKNKTPNFFKIQSNTPGKVKDVSGQKSNSEKNCLIIKPSPARSNKKTVPLRKESLEDFEGFLTQQSSQGKSALDKLLNLKQMQKRLRENSTRIEGGLKHSNKSRRVDFDLINDESDHHIDSEHDIENSDDDENPRSTIGDADDNSGENEQIKNESNQTGGLVEILQNEEITTAFISVQQYNLLRNALTSLDKKVDILHQVKIISQFRFHQVKLLTISTFLILGSFTKIWGNIETIEGDGPECNC